MSEPRDMDAPVTRRELHEALDTWSGAIVAQTAAHTASMIADSEQRMITQMETMLAERDTRLLAQTANMIGESEQRVLAQTSGQMATLIAESEKRVLGAVQLMFEASEQRLTYELRSQTKGSEHELATRLVAVDDQYKDLPARVTRLEAKVFAPPRRKRRRASRSR